MPKQSGPVYPSPSTPLPTIPLVVAVIAIALGAALAGQPSDSSILLAVQGLFRDQAEPWSFLTWSGLGVCGFVLLTSLSAQEPRRVAALLLTLLIGGLIVHAIKRLLQADRPAVYFGLDHPGFQVIGEVLKKGSMPSGHSATAWAVAALLVLHEGRATLWRHLWWVLAALQATSRIVVGAHWPSDVLVGSGLGLAVSTLVWRLQASARLADGLRRPGLRKAVALSLPAIGAYLCMGQQGWALPPVAQLGLMALCGWGAWCWWREAANPAIRTGSQA